MLKSIPLKSSSLGKAKLPSSSSYATYSFAKHQSSFVTRAATAPVPRRRNYATKSDYIFEVEEANFEEKVFKSNKPLLLDCHATYGDQLIVLCLQLPPGKKRFDF